MNITKINAYCPDDTMGETTAEDCAWFREHLREKLSAEYPEADVTVSSQQGKLYVETDEDGDDADATDGVSEFIGFCWDHCEWPK
jgi:hypothetical protein